MLHLDLKFLDVCFSDLQKCFQTPLLKVCKKIHRNTYKGVLKRFQEVEVEVDDEVNWCETHQSELCTNHCLVCNIEFTDEVLKEEHSQTCRRKKVWHYKCLDSCDHAPGPWITMWTHYQRNHVVKNLPTTAGKLKCPKCVGYFKGQKGLKQHLVASHKEKLTTVCPKNQCQKNLKTPRNLQ